MVDGNIGYQDGGKFPIRTAYDGICPSDGSTGENEWGGFIPFEELAVGLQSRVVDVSANPEAVPRI